MFTKVNQKYTEITQKLDANIVLKELGEELQFASSSTILQSKLLIIIEDYLNSIYRRIWKDGEFPKTTPLQRNQLEKMLDEVMALNSYKNEPKLKPELFNMSRNLGKKMKRFSGKLKNLSIPLIILAQTLSDIPS